MIYKLHPKKSNESKVKIDADSRDAAISYFSALLHLKKRDLLQIYKVDR
jgi:chromatin segregation and condensation protein Rec8/ScpA/Scc1 (kleisin family)